MKLTRAYAVIHTRAIASKLAQKQKWHGNSDERVEKAQVAEHGRRRWAMV